MPTPIVHKNLPPDENHGIISWAVADNDALAALAVTADDIDKVARVGDAYYALSSISPSLWIPLAGAGGAGSMPDFDTGSGRLVLGDSVAYVSPIFTPIDFDNRWTVWNLHIQLAAGSEGMTLTPEGVIRLNMQCSVKVSGQPAKPVYLSAPCLEGMFTSLNARVEGDALVHSISPTPTVAGAFVSKTSIHPRQLYVNPASIEYIDMEVLSYSGPSTGTLQLDIIDPKGQNSYMGTGTSLAGITSFPHTIRVFGS